MNNQQMDLKTTSRYLGSLDPGELGLSITVRDDLPPFLLEANEAIRNDHHEKANDLLSDENIATVHALLAQDPGRTDVMFVLGYLLKEIGRSDEVRYWYKRVLTREPNAMLANELRAMYQEIPNRLTDAITYGEQAAALDPGNAAYLMSLGKCLIMIGQRQRGRTLLKKAVRLQPNSYSLYASYLWYEHYFEEWGRAQFYQGYQNLGHLQKHNSIVYTNYENNPDPERRLRIGLLAPNFFNCSAACTLEPFLDAYSRDSLEVFVYGNVAHPDHVTDRMTAKVDHFTNVAGMPYDHIAHLICADKIDVLVGVAGLCAYNRMGIMKYRAAPVQVDWGGIDTSGLEEIHYRLSDGVLDPPALQAFYVEETVNLPGGMVCFTPIKESPPVGPLPALERGYVTYGSFNNCAKISDTTLSMWADVLLRTPQSRLVLKLSHGGDELVCKTYLNRFAQQGIDPERVEVMGYMPYAQYLQTLASVDMALDTFPYNGCITTLEALWMGAPIVTRCGETLVSRVGYTIMKHLGLELFVAHSQQEYIDKACAFASQLDQLGRIRQSLRPLLLASPLCDCRRLAREMEEAFRSLWRRWASEKMRQGNGVAK
jgi:protein O-GlcNAc transferase